MSLISALQLLQTNTIKTEFNIKAIMYFQKELGLSDLPKAVLEHKELLDAEMLSIMDGIHRLSNLLTLVWS